MSDLKNIKKSNFHRKIGIIFGKSDFLGHFVIASDSLFVYLSFLRRQESRFLFYNFWIPGQARNDREKV